MSSGRPYAFAMRSGSLIGQYARLVVSQGSGPLHKGLKIACRLTGLTILDPRGKQAAIRGEVVSNDADGPFPSWLLAGSLIITPEDPDLSEARMLEGGTFRARLGLLSNDGELVATGEGSLVRLSDEVPYERTCPGCQGWKICEDCAGTGEEGNLPCAYCEGSGQCTYCEGVGSVTELNDWIE